MFKNILVPVSSEYFPKKAMEKALELSKYFEANVEVIYIIEEKVKDKIQKASEYVRTDTQIEEIEEDINDAKKEEFNDAMKEWEDDFEDKVEFKTKIVKGKYSNEISEELKKYNADLIVMETEQESILDYSLFYKEDKTPIMIVR